MEDDTVTPTPAEGVEGEEGDEKELDMIEDAFDDVDNL